MTSCTLALSGPAVTDSVCFEAERPGDEIPREALLDAVMGPIRFRRSSQRLREGRDPAIALVARQGERIIGTVRLWHAASNGLPDAMLLGPLAVTGSCQGRGIGSELMFAAVEAARTADAQAIILVGDQPYYDRFGFRAHHADGLAMPGPFERHRLLALPLASNALDRAHGVLQPAGLQRATDDRASAIVARPAEYQFAS